MYRSAQIGGAGANEQPARDWWRASMQDTVGRARGRAPGHWFLLTVAAVVSIVLCSVAGVFAWRTVFFERATLTLNTADPAVGYAFYAALGQTLAGNETAPLQQIVTHDFIDHDSKTGSGRSIDELTSELSAFGATFPDAKISVQSIDSSGADLVARLAPMMPAQGSVAGLALAPIRIAGSVEVLHIRHGQVSERWATQLPQVLATTFAGPTVSTGGATDAWLYRATVPPGGELGWVSGTLSVAMAEQGTLSLKTTQEDELGALESRTEAIAAGSARQLAHQAKIRLRGDGGEPVEFLLLDIRPFDDPLFAPFDRLGGSTSKLLWHTAAPLQLEATWRMEIGRLALPAGMELLSTHPAGYEIVLGVEGAPIRLSIEAGSISHLETTYSLGPLDPSGMVDAGTAAQLTGVPAMRIHGLGPAASAIWIVTFGPLQTIPEDGAPDDQGPIIRQGQP